MFDQVDHYEFMEMLSEPVKMSWPPEMDEDDLMDMEQRMEEADRIRDGLREDGCPV